MANNYTQFSEALDVETDEQKAWLVDWLSPPSAGLLDPENEEALAKWAKRRGAEAGDAESWPSFDWSFSGEKNYRNEETAPWSLWLHADEGCITDNVANTVQAFFKQFKIDSTFTLTWAETCSSLRVGEFSGGGFIVMPLGKSVKWSTPYMLFDWVHKQLEKKKGKQ